MAAGTLVPLVVLLTVAFAGCIATEATPEAKQAPDVAAPPAFDDDTGALHGFVTNDEGMPIVGASIGIIETKQVELSAVNGEFTLNNLEPGTYTLGISALGYEAGARKVDIVAGQVTEASMTLVPLPVDEPFHVTIMQAGNVQCTVRAYPGVPTTGAGGLPRWITGVAVCGLVGIPTLPPDKFLLSWETDAGVQELLHEMEWVTNQATGKGLSTVLEVAGQPNNLDATYGDAIGVSPIRIYVNATKMAAVAETGGQDCFADDCEFQTRVFGAANTTEFYWPVDPPELGPLGKPSNKVDAGFVIDQKNNQYLTAFYGMPRPPGWTALADG